MLSRLVYLDSVDSTNTYVVTHFSELADGTLVAAASQTAGRGRRGRVWVTPPGCNIAATLVIKTVLQPFLVGTVTGLAGLQLAGELVPGASFYLKWPNDIYCGNRKLAGILCEGAGIVHGKIIGIAAGIGMNVNVPREILEQLEQPAVSLSVLAGRTWPMPEVLNRFAEIVGEAYRHCIQDPDGFFLDWKRENRLIGHRLDFIAADGKEYTGVFQDILPDGEMVLKLSDGSTRTLHCGDVRIRRDSIPFC